MASQVLIGADPAQGLQSPWDGGVWREEGTRLLLTLLAAMFVYFYPLTHFDLHVDVEAAAVYGSVWHTISLGRWGLSLVHSTVLHEPVVPYFTAALSLVFLAAAALATGQILKIPPPAHLAFAILYVSFPQFAYQIEFLNQSDCVAFGLFAATLSYGLLERALAAGERRVVHLAAAEAMLVIGVSMYDSLAFVIPTLCTLACVSGVFGRGMPARAITRTYFWAACLTISAYAISFSVGVAAQRHFGVARSSYFSHMVGWQPGAIGPPLFSTARFLLDDVGGGDFYGNNLYRAALAAAAVLLAAGIWRRFSLLRLGMLTALLVLALTMPFAVVAVLGDHQEARTFICEMIVYAGLVTLALGACGGRVLHNVSRDVLVAVLVLVSTFHVSRLFAADTGALTSDRMIAERVVVKIYSSHPEFQQASTPVYFHGAYAGPNIWRGEHYGTFGNSFFSWDGGATFRILAFMKACGVADFQLPTPQEAARVEPVLQGLPIWPDPDAIRLIDGVMVVRMGQ